MKPALFARSDYRRLVAGVGAAAAAGLLCGLVMQPDLRGPLDNEGPQMFVGLSGVRTPYGFDPSLGFTSYQGQVPDYVIGTDWMRPAEGSEVHVPPPPEDETYAFGEDDVAAYRAPVMAWQEPETEPVRYPSMDGGAPYGQVREPVRADAPSAPDDEDLAEMAAATPG